MSSLVTILLDKISALEDEVRRLKVAAGEVHPYEGFIDTPAEDMLQLIDEPPRGSREHFISWLEGYVDETDPPEAA